MNDLQLFRKLFYISFCRPILKTERFIDIWWDLERLRDYLAGPLYTIKTEGNCNYVYTDEEIGSQVLILLKCFCSGV